MVTKEDHFSFAQNVRNGVKRGITPVTTLFYIVGQDIANGWQERRKEDRNIRARTALTLEGGISPFVVFFTRVGWSLTHVPDISSMSSHLAPDAFLGFLLTQSILCAAAGYVLSEGWNVVQSYKEGRTVRRIAAGEYDQLNN